MDNAKKRRLAEALIGKSEVGRGTFAPLVEYSDGSIEPGLPGVINTPIQSIISMLAPGYDYSNTEQAARDSFNAAGLATVGGLSGARLKPAGSIGMGGGGPKMSGSDWMSRIDDIAKPSKQRVKADPAFKKKMKEESDEMFEALRKRFKDAMENPNK